MKARVGPGSADLEPGGVIEAPALEFDGLWYRYRAGTDFALQDVDFRADRGTWTVVVGPSGSGKTTLLKLATGLLVPTKGRVRALGRDLTERTLRGPLRGEIAYIPQQLGLVRHRTALENAVLGALSRVPPWASVLGAFDGAKVRSAEEALALVGLSHKKDEKVFRLSGGERQRVAIARTLVQRARVILADEFVSDLDEDTARTVMETMLDLRRAGTTILMALHDLRLAAEYGERALVLQTGRKVAEVDAASLDAHPVREVSTSRLPP